MLLKDARDEFLFDCECKHLAKGTIRNYKAETRFLVEFLELKQVTEVEEVKAHHIRDFMKQKQDAGSSACYVNDILKVCKTWFHYLVDEDYIEERRNPAAKVKNVRQPKTIIETFSVQEMKSLIHFYVLRPCVSFYLQDAVNQQLNQFPLKRVQQKLSLLKSSSKKQKSQNALTLNLIFQSTQ